MVNLAPQPGYSSLVGPRVKGFWDDLFGSSDETEPTTSSTSVDSSSKIFLDIVGVDGESTDDSHEGWIDILSFTMSMAKPSSGSTTTRSRSSIVIEDIIIVKELDKSSPKLMEKCAKGQVITELVIEFCKEIDDSLVTIYRYELSNVLITSFICKGSSFEEVPVEELSINFEEITVTYTEFDNDGLSKGNVEFTWKIEESIA
jgi:type VI secretion system secreted protein Hcp